MKFHFTFTSLSLHFHFTSLNFHFLHTANVQRVRPARVRPVNPEFDGLFLSYRIMHVSYYPPYRFGGCRIRHLQLFPTDPVCATTPRSPYSWRYVLPFDQAIVRNGTSGSSFTDGDQCFTTGVSVSKPSRSAGVISMAGPGMSFQPNAVLSSYSTSRSRTLVSHDDAT